MARESVITNNCSGSIYAALQLPAESGVKRIEKETLMLEYTLIILFCCFPIFLVGIAKIIGYWKGNRKYNFWLNVVASYGIYCVAMLLSFANTTLDIYMITNCPPVDEISLPCSLWLYQLNAFLLENLLKILLVTAVVANCLYLYLFGRKVTLNKLNQSGTH